MSEQQQAEEEKARASAEARRQRILEGSSSRMDKVSGLQSEDNTTTNNNDTTTNSNASKGSSKLAAMRRRRFKKKAAETGQKSEPVEAGSTPDTTTTTTATTTATTATATTTTTATATTTATTATATTTTATTTQQEEPVVAAVDAPAAKQTKKYLGVARMQRKKLHEKKQQQQQQQAAKRAPTAKIPKWASLADRLAIYLHVVVVFLLFGAGLDVGLQTQLSHEAVVLHDAPLAPREMNFLNLLPATVNPFVSTATPIQKQDILLDDNNNNDVDDDNTNEFETPVVRGAENHQANLDPLFGVDLDAITAGPGLLLLLGRQAVKVHRMILSVFYYGPAKVWNGGVQVLESLWTIPPILGLIALVMRQLVANVLLGAKLPAVTEDESEQKDAISTMVNFVKTFLTGSFPMLVGLYSAFTQLRTDMYIVACGLLVGLTLSHTVLLPGPPADASTTGDEL